MIWLLRYECQFHYPSSLPKLLSCVQWNNYVDVAKVGDCGVMYTGVPLTTQTGKPGKWEGIFQSGKSQGILKRLEKSGISDKYYLLFFSDI